MVGGKREQTRNTLKGERYEGKERTKEAKYEGKLRRRKKRRDKDIKEGWREETNDETRNIPKGIRKEDEGRREKGNRAKGKLW